MSLTYPTPGSTVPLSTSRTRHRQSALRDQFQPRVLSVPATVPAAGDRQRAGGGGTADHGAVARGDGVKALISEIRAMILSARRAAVYSVDLIQVVTNFEIGRRIVEHEQQGEQRAEYGKALLKELSAELSAEFGRGFSRSNLEYMRKFYLTYQDRAVMISQMSSGKFVTDQKSQIPYSELDAAAAPLWVWQMPSAKSTFPF